jgi:predicted phosphodiesterase
MLRARRKQKPAVLVRPLVVMSDLHLGPRGQDVLVADVASLIGAHPGHEIILNGDTFALSADPDPTDPFRLADAVLAGQPQLRTALRDHLAQGSPVTMVAGNHDAALGLPRARARLLLALGLADSAPLTLVPWFVRRGRAHVEHGHVYDPDNAPAHPLVPWSPAVEPLGVALTRRLIAPFAADRFAHAYDTTPLLGLRRALGTYGSRGLALALGYFAVALSLVGRAGKPGSAEGQDEGAACRGYARTHGLAAEQMQALLEIRALPTHHSRVLTFRRLYLDRALAFVCLLLGLLGAWATAAPELWWVGAVAGTLLVGSVLLSPSRYRGLTEARLRSAARRIIGATAVDLVVFGHSHFVESSPGYCNTGLFASSKDEGRRYLLVETSGQASLRVRATAKLPNPINSAGLH